MEGIDKSMQLEPESTLGRALAGVDAALRETGEARLPRVIGLDGRSLEGSVLARWLHRRWLQEGAGWQPFLAVAPAHLAVLPDGGRGWWSVARAGWVYVGPAVPDFVPEGLRSEARAHRLCLLIQDGGPPIPAPTEWINAVQRFDPFHVVATDPGLELLRRSLLSHCRSLSPVHLNGEQGTGKAALAGWAHALLDDRPLSRIRGDSGRPQPGEWALFEEVGELSRELQELLEERLRELDTPQPAPRTFRTRARPRHSAFEGIIGESAALVEVLEQVMAVASSRLPILITGEPGVGKEALARAAHVLSGRTGAFIALDMGSLAESLAESALFGHRRGAFTGAERQRAGAFRSADGGTLFLDEIGNLPPSLQIRLLRVLQEGEVTPLGEDVPVKVDVRVVAATNVDLDQVVRRGGFRADLLGRLNAATLRLPSLRDRLEDLELLARYFLMLERKEALGQALEGQTHRGADPGVDREADRGGDERWCTPAARAVLLAHRWPGNIRELSNVVRYAAAVAPPGEPIDAVHLGPLSPRNRRRTPLISTSSHGRREEGWGMDRHLAQVMTATLLNVPPLRDRGSDSRRHIILHLLGGRPIHPAALRLLEEQPWWGNLVELEAAQAALRALPPGGIDVERLEHYLPHLAGPGGQAPIRVLLSPSRGADGRVDGLTRDFGAGALLVGRVRDLEELRRAARAGDRRVSQWLEALRERCGAAEPECLELGLLNRLSRAHFLITRAGRGFRVHLLPSVGLPVLAGPLEPIAAPLQAVYPESPVELGSAGEVQVTGTDGRPYLRLFVFAGVVAFEEYAGRALLRVESGTGASMPTVMHTLKGGPLPAGATPGGSMFAPTPGQADEPVAPGLRVWAVDSREEALLTDLLLELRGGQLKAHFARLLPRLREPAYARLVDYLERAPRLSQYLVRLYELPENDGLRRKLRERLELEPDREVRLALLPEGLRRCLEAVD